MKGVRSRDLNHPRNRRRLNRRHQTARNRGPEPRRPPQILNLILAPEPEHTSGTVLIQNAHARQDSIAPVVKPVVSTSPLEPLVLLSVGH
jgi:hypothetical protein